MITRLGGKMDFALCLTFTQTLFPLAPSNMSKGRSQETKTWFMVFCPTQLNHPPHHPPPPTLVWSFFTTTFTSSLVAMLKLRQIEHSKSPPSQHICNHKLFRYDAFSIFIGLPAEFPALKEIYILSPRVRLCQKRILFLTYHSR